ncbi:MAG: transposase [Pyrinomonadaceae bacterium]|nr:transposase [Pyrinomonadaceae bacterium]
MWKNYDDEFKRNALQKVFNGQSVRSVAEERGVNESLIHKWKRAAKTFGDGKQTGSEVSEIEALLSAFIVMPGDTGVGERLLCLAEKINQTAVPEKKAVS